MPLLKCCAPGCEQNADFEVLLYDVYLHPGGDLFMEQDRTCPHLCGDHMVENERTAEGERKPRGITYYRFTNAHRAQGFTIYRKLPRVSGEN